MRGPLFLSQKKTIILKIIKLTFFYLQIEAVPPKDWGHRHCQHLSTKTSPPTAACRCLPDTEQTFLFPKASREKLIDHYIGHNSEDPALEGASTG